MTQPQYLLVTNGSAESRPALTYGIHLAQTNDAFITLAGIVEPTDRHHPVKPVLHEIEAALQTSGLSWRRQMLDGYAEQAIDYLVANYAYDLLIVGPLGRPPLRRWLQGYAIRHFMEDVNIPILYTPTAPWPPQRILICLGGLGYAQPAEKFGLEIALKKRAEVTLLHVVPPLERSYPLTEKIRRDWQHVHETDTIIGRSLRAALGKARSAGLQPTLQIRHGEVIDEILNEIKSRDYDLVCMGSPYSARGLRQLYTPNITAEIAEHCQLPVYMARCAQN